MNDSLIALIFIVIAWTLAILGGHGVGGLGKVSRDLGEREKAEDGCSRASPESSCRGP